jgi:hypothetical protein
VTKKVVGVFCAFFVRRFLKDAVEHRLDYLMQDRLLLNASNLMQAYLRLNACATFVSIFLRQIDTRGYPL